jgi:hypothetical protein
VLEPLEGGRVWIVRFERRARTERAFAFRPVWVGRIERFEELLLGGSFFAFRLTDSV